MTRDLPLHTHDTHPLSPTPSHLLPHGPEVPGQVTSGLIFHSPLLPPLQPQGPPLCAQTWPGHTCPTASLLFPLPGMLSSQLPKILRLSPQFPSGPCSTSSFRVKPPLPSSSKLQPLPGTLPPSLPASFKLSLVLLQPTAQHRQEGALLPWLVCSHQRLKLTHVCLGPRIAFLDSSSLRLSGPGIGRH